MLLTFSNPQTITNIYDRKAAIVSNLDMIEKRLTEINTNSRHYNEYKSLLENRTSFEKQLKVVLKTIAQAEQHVFNFGY